MTRRDELLKVIGDNKTLLPLVDRLLFLEEQLEKLEKLPLIKINPKILNSKRTGLYQSYNNRR